MIKKKYLLILSVAIVSVLLGSLFYNNITEAQKGKEPTQVDVVNLPTDEQGNLRTTIVETSKIMLVFNESLTVSSSVSNFIYLTSFNTSGFKYVYVMAKAQGSWEVGRAVIDICVYENNFGIQTLLRIFDLDTTIETYTHRVGVQEVQVVNMRFIQQALTYTYEFTTQM